MTYNPCTAAQYRIMGYLREAFETSLCLIYPSRPNAMVLEDQFGEKLEFFFRDGKILEHSLMPPADPASVDLFRRCLDFQFPVPSQKTFSARIALWSTGAFPLTYQQALDLPDDLFRHYLKTQPLTKEEVRDLAARGSVTEPDFWSMQLWRLDGHTEDCMLCGPWDDGGGTYGILFLPQPGQQAEELHFYVT